MGFYVQWLDLDHCPPTQCTTTDVGTHSLWIACLIYGIQCTQHDLSALTLNINALCMATKADCYTKFTHLKSVIKT